MDVVTEEPWAPDVIQGCSGALALKWDGAKFKSLLSHSLVAQPCNSSLTVTGHLLSFL